MRHGLRRALGNAALAIVGGVLAVVLLRVMHALPDAPVDLRPLVLGFDEAAPHHGGAGALYVRLRRSRACDAP